MTKEKTLEGLVLVGTAAVLATATMFGIWYYEKNRLKQQDFRNAVEYCQTEKVEKVPKEYGIYSGKLCKNLLKKIRKQENNTKDTIIIQHQYNQQLY